MPYEIPDDVPPVAVAWVYSGDWVADCPRPADPITHKGCGNVEFLYEPSRVRGPRDREKTFYVCSSCGFQAEIHWPRRREEIMMALSVRPVPGTRNWWPRDHPVAVNSRQPHGQSVADLLAENEEHGLSNEPVRGLR